jgi:hypothetical protein
MEEDFFSDDDLQIPDDTLQELEHNAISSTQIQSQLIASSRLFTGYMYRLGRQFDLLPHKHHLLFTGNG